MHTVHARTTTPLWALAALPLLCACINSESNRGVEARWHGEAAAGFEVGKTTRSEVLRALGPPSQILTVGEGTVFYYLLEQSTTEGLILLVYNRSVEAVDYDRAVYFFDAQDVLTDFAETGAER